MSEVTLLLKAATSGNEKADERLWQIVYDELRSMAGAMVSQESREVTLSGTALLHEAWLRLTGPEGTALEWDSRRHFFAAAAEAMRRILVDQARHRQRQKRGGGAVHEPLENATRVTAPDDDKTLMVHEVLDELAAIDPQKALVVKLRFLIGYSHNEIAALLGVSEVTVRRQWKVAKAWLYQALKDHHFEPSEDEGKETEA